MGSHLLPVEQGKVCQDIHVAAHFATVVPWLMRGTVFWTARISMAFGRALQSSLMSGQIDDVCGTMRTLKSNLMQGPESCLCSHIGHLCGDPDIKTDSF